MKMKRKKIVIIIISVLAIFLIASPFLFGGDKTEYLTVDLGKQDLGQTVSEIGTVRASQEIGLNFLQPGRLSTLNFAVDDQVEEGDVLAELDYESLLIRQEEVLAALSIAKTNQEKLIRGAPSQDLAVLEAQVRQAESAKISAQGDLDSTKRVVNENISQAEKTVSDLKAPNSIVPMVIKQSVESAKINLSNTERTGQQNLNNNRDSLLSSLDYNFSVARSSLDSIKRILEDDDIKNVFSVKNYFYKIESKRSYDHSMELLVGTDNYIKEARSNPSQENIKKASDELILFLNQVFSTLNYCFSALENTITSSSFPQASLDSFKVNVNTNKTQVSSATNALQGAYFAYTNAILNHETGVLSAQDNLQKAEAALSDAILNAENASSLARINGDQQILLAESRLNSASRNYDVVKSQLDKLRSPASYDDLRLAQAQVDQATASLNLIEKQIEDNLIKAPISGRIVRISYEIGEQVTGAKPVISLLAENNFEIEVLISESDISKIKLNNEAKVTFDAFGSDYEVLGQVYFIEPAATSIADVIYYKIKINFPENELENSGFLVKPGMTANIDITTNFKNDVFAVPARAVLSRNGGERYVRILEGRSFREVPVQVGISGDQAMVEIISEDLKEGDLIITSIRNN